MNLLSFRVFKYRNVQDSGEINVEQLTVMVGKNQSGKTALLRALHKLNPYDKNDKYDLINEWPRGERRNKNPEQIVCRAKFELSSQELSELSSVADTQIDSEIVEISKFYNGNIEVNFASHNSLFPNLLHPNEIDDICSALPAPDNNSNEKFKETASACICDIKTLAKEGKYTELLDTSNNISQRLQSVQTPQNQDANKFNIEQQFITSISQQILQISKRIKDEPSIRMRAHDVVVRNMPVFIYMDDYREFKGTANLEDLKRHLSKKTLDEHDKTILILMELSGLNIDQLSDQGKSTDPSIVRQRQLDLEDASLSLTNDITGRWNQQSYSIHFVADGDKFFVEITADRNVGRIPLEQQSKGFQWFFSFDLRFMYESKGTYKGCVLLLDEPGLHLHPGAQKDLLTRLDAYSQDNQLLYTTHLPFLIDLREPNRIRVINQSDNGACVSDDLSISGPDEKLTLQSALGMSLQQSYLVSQNNLVVEGVDDFIIITEL